MVLDITIILIFVISTIRGKAKGLGETAIRFAALIASVALGVMFTKQLAELLSLTPLDEMLAENLRQSVQADSISLADALPGGLGTLLKVFGSGGTTMEITKCAELLLSIISFVLIVIVVWGISVVLRRKLRKSRKEGGLVGTVDSVVGLVYGALRGAILVMLLLAFMFPFAGIFMPEKIPAITENLNNSFIAGPLYDLNPLLMFLRWL